MDRLGIVDRGLLRDLDLVMRFKEGLMIEEKKWICYIAPVRRSGFQYPRRHSKICFSP
jgi:hypothetical protein